MYKKKIIPLILILVLFIFFLTIPIGVDKKLPAYRGITSIAALDDGFIVGVAGESDKRHILKWSTKKGRARFIAEIDENIPISKWKRYIGLHPYDCYTKLYPSSDGEFVVLITGFPESIGRVFLLDVKKEEWTEVFSRDGVRDIDFIHGTHIFRACLIKGFESKGGDPDESPDSRYAVVEYDCDRGHYKDLYAWGEKVSIGVFPLSPICFHELVEGIERYGMVEFSPPYNWTFGLFQLTGNDRRLRIPGKKGIGTLGESWEKRYFSPDGTMVATDNRILMLRGETLWERLWSLPDATEVTDVNGLYQCEGWNPDGEYVAYTGARGGETVHMYNGKVEPKDPDYLAEDHAALVVFDKHGNCVVKFKLTTQNIVSFVQWVDSQTVLFYNTSKKRVCLLRLGSSISEIPISITYH